MVALPIRARAVFCESTTEAASPPASQVAEPRERTTRLQSIATAAFPAGAPSPGAWANAFPAEENAASHKLRGLGRAFAAKSAKPWRRERPPREPDTAGTIRSNHGR